MADSKINVHELTMDQVISELTKRMGQEAFDDLYELAEMEAEAALQERISVTAAEAEILHTLQEKLADLIAKDQ